MKLKALTSFFCVFTTMLVLGDVVKSNITSSKMLSCKEAEVYTAADYIQDGLIFMIDAIENAGWGVHDPDSELIMDLVSGVGLRGWINRNPKWTDNALTNGVAHFMYSTCKQAFDRIANAKQMTSEFCTKYLYKQSNPMGPRILVTTSSNVTYTIMQYSINRNNDYWNIATRALDEIHTTWNYTPNFAYGTGHTATVGFDGIQQMSHLHVDGKFIRSTTAATELVAEINPSKIEMYQFWTGLGDPAVLVHCYRIYDRKLSDEEVRHNAKVDKARFGL